MASILKVDELQGITAAGDITITSEGGAATQSLQQGLAKAWVNFNGTGTIASRDSLNVSGLVDNGTGNYTVNLTNAFGAADYCMVSQVYSDNESFCSLRLTRADFLAGSNSFLIVISAGGTTDAQFINTSYAGDLA